MQHEFIERIDDALYRELPRLHNASLYHTPEWHRFLASALGHQVSAFVGYGADGSLESFLPVVRKPKFGKPVFVSLPFSHRVGPATRAEQSSPFEGAPIPELRLIVHDRIDGPGIAHSSAYDITILDLASWPDIGKWKASLPSKSVLYMLKRAQREGVSVETTGSDESWSDFFELMGQTRHRQGSPLYPSDFFPKLRAQLAPPLCTLYLARLNGQALSGAVVFRYGGTASYAYSASTDDRTVKNLGGGELCLFQAIADAHAAGCKEFDFGSTPHSLPELKAYKEKWGGLSRPLTRSFFPAELARSGVQRNSRAVKCASAVLKALPHPLYTRITPMLFKVL